GGALGGEPRGRRHADGSAPPRGRGAAAPHDQEDPGAVRREPAGDQDTMSDSQGPDLRSLLETAQRIQTQVGRVKDELGGKSVEAETGGGLVRCTANGRGEILSVTIDPA